MRFKLLVGLLFGLVMTKEFNELDIICDWDGDGKYDCAEFRKYAGNSRAINDYQGVVDQYMTMILCGCTNGSDVESIYDNLGRAYEKIGKIDSSTWAFKEGLKILPENENLLLLAAWSSAKEFRNGNPEKLNEQLYFLERLLEINPDDSKVLEKISDAYKRANMFEEQIVVLNQWLEIDGNNKKAITNKKEAFESLGKDASEVDQERWEKEPDNLEYGILYLNSLMNKEDYEESVSIAEEILIYHDSDKRLLRLVSDAYMKNMDDRNAVKYLKKLLAIDIENNNYMIKLSDTYLNLYDFENAYLWANKAIGLNKLIGKSYFQRAEVLVQLVDNFRSDELDFCDRLVFDLAMEDYNTAYKNGVLNAKVYKNNLIELITTVGDWFLLGDKFTELSLDSQECQEIKGADCYAFIDRKVQKK